jgi:hypothetical protein
VATVTDGALPSAEEGIMFARSTTIQAQPSAIGSGIAYILDDVLPGLLDVDGCVGLSLLVDRQSGRCIATSAWRSAETMHASEAQVRRMRNRAAEAFGGTPQVEEWEIAALHRDHRSRDGACVRVTWIRADPGRLEHAIDVYRMSAQSTMEHLEGFCSASLLVDRLSGRGVISVTYDSQQAMERTRAEAASVRATGTRQAGAQVIDVCEFELVLAHLRVPELA